MGEHIPSTERTWQAPCPRAWHSRPSFCEQQGVHAMSGMLHLHGAWGSKSWRQPLPTPPPQQSREVSTALAKCPEPTGSLQTSASSYQTELAAATEGLMDLQKCVCMCTCVCMHYREPRTTMVDLMTEEASIFCLILIKRPACIMWDCIARVYLHTQACTHTYTHPSSGLQSDTCMCVSQVMPKPQTRSWPSAATGE